jgi:hypothetical protein
VPRGSKTAQLKVGNSRVTGKEQFYTSRETAEAVVSMVLKRTPGALTRPWLEPSGGTGIFIDVLRERGVTDITSVDIEPKHPDVLQQDFLTWTPTRDDYITIGNPPFGRNNALSVPFFNKAATMSTDVVFIVPASWRKWSVTNRLDLDFSIVHDENLNVNYVDELGNENYAGQKLNTCVQWWTRSAPRRMRISVQDNNLVQKTTPQEADVAITWLGWGCGTVHTTFERKPNTTLLFLKLVQPQALHLLQKADFSEFYNRTSYTQSLSLQEINYRINELLYGDPCIIYK